ncbi:hypothetical protein [Paenibacillus polymyxa]|uniref:hypothetical protein n=1 Tax=Paenibacillus polymyxa TaxID=1406 RepID=UPI002E793590|nr:hypothetical protein [Paenibacillus polymyxa]
MSQQNSGRKIGRFNFVELKISEGSWIVPNTSILFETTKIGNIVLKNRLGVAPMIRTSASPEGFATDQMAQY